MTKPQLSNGLVHQIPEDFETALLHNNDAVTTWENISVKARNEWICWVITVKQEKTRAHHIVRAVAELSEGKRRPCCWGGCFHRTDKPVGKWAQRVLLNKETKTT